MEKILNFCGDHYILFTILALIALFALIGYFVNMKTKAHQEFKFEKNTDPDFSNIELKDKNASLNEMIFHDNMNVEKKNEPVEKIEENLFENPGLVIDNEKHEEETFIDNSLFENPGLIVNEPINNEATLKEKEELIEPVNLVEDHQNDIFASNTSNTELLEDMQTSENPESL